MFETIVALATPPLKSALAVIRVSGNGCFDIVSKVFSKDLRQIDKRTALVGDIKNGEQTIDQAVLIAYKGPRSFTGEDSVEILSHGSMLIVNQIIDLLIANGARYAERGEYSMRSFLNGKMDLVQAESINDLINASTQEAKDLIMMSLEGKVSELIQPLKVKLADLISLIEVNIDYPEYEDIEQANSQKILQFADEIIEFIDNLVKDGEKGRIVKDGVKVAIVGKPNVGKSSLLNALMDEEKAIVTDIAGTTRDIVEGDINVNGIVLHLLDTAGIRDSYDTVESIGINRAKKAIEEAELVLVVLDSSRDIDDEDKEIIELAKNKSCIIVYNKADIKNPGEDKISVSALKKDIQPLRDKIYEVLGLDEKAFKSPSLNNARQIGLLKQAKKSMETAKEDTLNNLSVDLISVSLMDAYSAICEILGEKSEIDISKEIFSRFCVGK